MQAKNRRSSTENPLPKRTTFLQHQQKKAFKTNKKALKTHQNPNWDRTQNNELRQIRGTTHNWRKSTGSSMKKAPRSIGATNKSTPQKDSRQRPAPQGSE
jgi:hypothetical protein